MTAPTPITRRLRLTSRAILTLSQGLALLTEAKNKAIKANQAAFSSPADLYADLEFINGDGNEKLGLSGLLRGEQPELDFGGSYDEKLEILDILEVSFGQDELFVAQKLLTLAAELQGKFGIPVPDLLVLLHDRLPEIATEEYQRVEAARQIALAEEEATREKTPQELADEAEAANVDDLAKRRKGRKGKLPPTLDEAIAEEDALQAAGASGDEVIEQPRPERKPTDEEREDARRAELGEDDDEADDWKTSGPSDDLLDELEK